MGKIPRQGEYDAGFFEKLDEYLVKLSICKGRFIIKPLNSLTDRLAADMATLADLTDDDVLWDISKRSIVSAWKAGCLLWVLNDQTWTKAMGELVEWLVYHDIWSKMQLFADLLNQDADSVSEAQRRGPKNLLDDLPNPFNEAQLESLRLQLGKSKDGTKGQIRKWVFRKFITFSAETGLYTKTEEYLTGSGTSDGIARNGGRRETSFRRGSRMRQAEARGSGARKLEQLMGFAYHLVLMNELLAGWRLQEIEAAILAAAALAAYGWDDELHGVDAQRIAWKLLYLAYEMRLENTLAALVLAGKPPYR